MGWSARCGARGQIGFANWFPLFEIPPSGLNSYSKFFCVFFSEMGFFPCFLFLVLDLTRFLKTLNGLVREMWCARSNWLCKLVSPVCASQYWKVSLETDYYCLVASTTLDSKVGTIVGFFTTTELTVTQNFFFEGETNLQTQFDRMHHILRTNQFKVLRKRVKSETRIWKQGTKNTSKSWEHLVFSLAWIMWWRCSLIF
jgi:hypothetical protein